MAIITRALTNFEVKNAKSKEKEYVLYDGNGLMLIVKPNGNKIWHFRYKRPVTQKRTVVSLGLYPQITLDMVRDIHHGYLNDLNLGIDPQDRIKQVQQQNRIEEESRFINVALAWFEIKKSSISADYAIDIWRSLEKDVLPTLRDIPVSDIKARTLISLLQPVRARGALETVRRLIQRLSEIMIYAVTMKLIDSNPVYGISTVFEKPKRQNMLTIRPEALPKLMRDIHLSNLGLLTRCLLDWQLLTLTRPSEAVGARWQEIDQTKKLWTIPAERMKAKREHVIPLSPQALLILEAIAPISSNREYLFPSRINRHTPMNNQTANAALKRIGYKDKLVAHGLRSIASTAMNEAEFNPDVIEAALAHVDKNDVRRAYNISTYLEQRRRLMD